LPNRAEFPIAFFPLELIGAVATTVNPDLRMRELDYIFRLSNSRTIICVRKFRGFDYLDMMRELQKDNAAIMHIIVSGEVAEAHDLDKGNRGEGAAAGGEPLSHDD
jgi:cyclohexanecarboxylate-CoA ligase